MRANVLVTLLGLLMATGCQQDLVTQLRENPDYCPADWDEVRTTVGKQVCDRLVFCGWLAPGSEDGCMLDIAGRDRACINECGTREWILWYDDHATDCDAGIEPVIRPTIWECVPE